MSKGPEIIFPIEKCSSPIGDGNRFVLLFVVFENLIEKCSSPIGDGNSKKLVKEKKSKRILRNVAPR